MEEDVRGAEVVIRLRLGLCRGRARCEGGVGGAGGGMVVYICHPCIIGGEGGGGGSWSGGCNVNNVLGGLCVAGVRVMYMWVACVDGGFVL